MPSYFARDKEINQLFTESEKMYRNLIESMRVGIYMADAKGVLFFVNQAFVDFLGYNSKQEMLGLNLESDIYPDPEERKKFIQSMEKNGFVRDYEVRNVRKDKSIVILSATSNFIRNDKGEVIGIEGIVCDITEKKHLEERLSLEKIKLEEILTFGEGVSAICRLDQLVDFIVEKAASILEAQKCSLMLYDDTTDELCIKGSKGLKDEIITKTRIKLGEGIAGEIAKKRQSVLVPNIEYDKRFRRKSGAGYRGRSFMSASIKFKEKLIGIINIADRTTVVQYPFSELDLKILCAIVRQAAVAIENAKLYKELEYLSVTDPVTNLYNYRCFVSIIEDEIQRFHRFKKPFCLLMIDVDDFKSYNDTFGHVAGDQYLKELGELMTGNVRAVDKVCRYGGDEFVILLPGTSVIQAKIVGEKLKETIAKHAFKKNMSISVGVAEFKSPLNRFEFTMRVDRALYQAKRQGKNQVFIYG